MCIRDRVEIPVDTSRTMLIAMNEDQQALSEVVVVGYGKKKKSNVAGATAKINLKAKEKYKTPQPVIGKRKYKKYLEENLIRPNDESCKDVKGEVVDVYKRQLIEKSEIKQPTYLYWELMRKAGSGNL